jgi:hypothetical protein
MSSSQTFKRQSPKPPPDVVVAEEAAFAREPDIGGCQSSITSSASRRSKACGLFSSFPMSIFDSSRASSHSGGFTYSCKGTFAPSSAYHSIGRGRMYVVKVGVVDHGEIKGTVLNDQVPRRNQDGKFNHRDVCCLSRQLSLNFQKIQDIETLPSRTEFGSGKIASSSSAWRQGKLNVEVCRVETRRREIITV